MKNTQIVRLSDKNKKLANTLRITSFIVKEGSGTFSHRGLFTDVKFTINCVDLILGISTENVSVKKYH